MAATAKIVDFSNVKEGGNFNKGRIPAGDYRAVITKVEDAASKEDKTPMFLFTIKVKRHASSSFPYYCKLQENQLWKLRNILVAAGVAVPKSKFKLDPNKVVNREVGVAIIDAEYEGKDQSEIDAIFPASELEDGGVPSSAATDEPEDAEAEVAGGDDDEEEVEVEEEAEEEDEAEEDDQFVAMDRNGLKVFIKGKDAAFRFLKSHTDDDLRAAARQLELNASVTDDEMEELDVEDM